MLPKTQKKKLNMAPAEQCFILTWKKKSPCVKNDDSGSGVRPKEVVNMVLKGPRFISNTLKPRKAVPSLNVPTCAFFENNLIPGELKLKTLNMEHFVQRQSGDSFCDQLRHPISKKNSSIQNGSISIGRSYSKIAFLGLRKGTPPL